MPKKHLISGIIFILAAVCNLTLKAQKMTTNDKAPAMLDEKIKAPTAEKQAKELSIHGDTRIDNYYWLNERENPKVIEYLEAENAYKKTMMGHTEEFQEKLYDEIVRRIKQEDQSVPYKKNGYYYITRYEKGKEYPIYSRKKETLEAEEEIMFDVNVMAEGHDYYQLGGLSVSPDNKITSFAIDTVSRRIYTIGFKNLETGEILKDKLEITTGGATWANDNKTIFYTKKEEGTLRSYKIFKHVLGTEQSEDVEVYHEADDTYGCYVYKTKSKKYLVVGSYSTLASEIRVLNADTPNGTFEVFEARPTEKGGKHEYRVAHFEDKWYIVTNWEAENFRLMETPEGKTAKENWKEVIPHRKDVLLQGIDVFADYMVLSERIDGITQIRVKPWEGEGHFIDFGEDAFLAYTSVNPEFDTDVLRVGYTSLTTPNSTYDYNMNDKKLTLLKQQEVVGDFDAKNYESERIYVTARDGVKVPVSLVYKKGFKKDGKAPLLLNAYGSYGYSSDPYFSSVRLSLLDRGFCYAIAHIRGGQEMGRHWYENGKLLKKKNTFNDFVDCSKHLIENNYTSSESLFAMGGSAGGLLMGAIINMNPELYRGVIAAVPFVDVITTMLDESIPLTTGEFDEWGNPKDKEYYDYIKSYSPYDNVEAKDYPNMLVTTGLHDSQVQYWEPAKWVAKLRELKTDDNLLLLHTEMEAGHGGKSGRFARYYETALQYAFFLDLMGIEE